jgi:hypothetical protein
MGLGMATSFLDIGLVRGEVQVNDNMIQLAKIKLAEGGRGWQRVAECEPHLVAAAAEGQQVVRDVHPIYTR